MKYKETPGVTKQEKFHDTDPSRFYPSAPNVRTPCTTATLFLDSRVQDITKQSSNDDVNLPYGDIPTGSYVSLLSKHGQRFLLVVTEATPGNINSGYWDTLKENLASLLESHRLSFLFQPKLKFYYV